MKEVLKTKEVVGKKPRLNINTEMVGGGRCFIFKPHREVFQLPVQYFHINSKELCCQQSILYLYAVSLQLYGSRGNLQQALNG